MFYIAPNYRLHIMLLGKLLRSETSRGRESCREQVQSWSWTPSSRESCSRENSESWVVADSGSRGRESCRGPCNLNTAGHNEHSGRAQRARNNNILRLKASWTKNIEYQILREWTLEQPSRRDTTWKLITAALRVFFVFTTWGDRPEIRFWSQKI